MPNRKSIKFFEEKTLREFAASHFKISRRVVGLLARLLELGFDEQSQRGDAQADQKNDRGLQQHRVEDFRQQDAERAREFGLHLARHFAHRSGNQGGVDDRQFKISPVVVSERRTVCRPPLRRPS